MNNPVDPNKYDKVYKVHFFVDNIVIEWTTPLLFKTYEQAKDYGDYWNWQEGYQYSIIVIPVYKE